MSDVAVAMQKAHILQDKLDQRIADYQAKNQDVLNRIEAEGNMLADLLVPLGVTDPGHGDNRAVRFMANGSVKAILQHTSTEDLYTMHRHAVKQTAEKFGVATRYAQDLAYGEEQWQRDLIAHILNEHSVNTKRSRVLMRTVNGQIRGVLSDKYRRLDTPMIYTAFLKGMAEVGGKVVDAYMDDTRSWIEAVEPTAIPIETEHNGTVVMAFGARISNSDYGDGSLILSAYNMQVLCLNGMVGQNTIKQIHLGRQIPDDIKLSARTYRLDSEAQASLVSDAMKNLLDRDAIINQGQRIQKAASMLIEDVTTELPRLRDLGVHKKEGELIMNKLMDSNPDDGLQGRNTVWKMSQAINATANVVDDQRRKRELEEIAGAFMLNKTK